MSVAAGPRTSERPARHPALLCALPLERAALAGVARRPGIVRRVGVGPAAARAGAERAVALGADALVSAGFCGAVAGDLAPGDIVVATTVIEGPSGRTHACDEALTRGVRGRRGPIESRDRIARGPEDRRDSPGIAIDMESAWIAEVATRHGLPFAVLRAVSDGSASRVPSAIDESGRLRLGRLRARDLPAVLRLGRGAARAGRALRRAARGALESAP